MAAKYYADIKRYIYYYLWEKKTEKSEYLPEIENLQDRFLNISKTFEKEIKKLRPNVLL